MKKSWYFPGIPETKTNKTNQIQHQSDPKSREKTTTNKKVPADCVSNDGSTKPKGRTPE